MDYSLIPRAQRPTGAGPHTKSRAACPACGPRRRWLGPGLSCQPLCCVEVPRRAKLCADCNPEGSGRQQE
eukprot:scaffold225243_cov32-Tisochrysis_lutea.AAC.2